MGEVFPRRLFSCFPKKRKQKRKKDSAWKSSKNVKVKNRPRFAVTKIESFVFCPSRSSLEFSLGLLLSFLPAVSVQVNVYL